MTAVDPVDRLIKAAVQARFVQNYAVATAAELPIEDAQFDLVEAYNVLMNTNDGPAALKEIRRVKLPSRRFYQ